MDQLRKIISLTPLERRALKNGEDRVKNIKGFKWRGFWGFRFIQKLKSPNLEN